VQLVRLELERLSAASVGRVVGKWTRTAAWAHRRAPTIPRLAYVVTFSKSWGKGAEPRVVDRNPAARPARRAQ
jgi:hypothetical protein